MRDGCRRLIGGVSGVRAHTGDDDRDCENEREEFLKRSISSPCFVARPVRTVYGRISRDAHQALTIRSLTVAEPGEAAAANRGPANFRLGRAPDAQRLEQEGVTY